MKTVLTPIVHQLTWHQQTVTLDRATVTAAEEQAREALKALRALTDWARENTSPRDPNSPHQLLVTAQLVLTRSDATAQLRR